MKKIKNLSSLDILGLFLIFFITASLYLLLGRKTEYLEITIRLFNHDAPEYSLDSNKTLVWYVDQIQPGKIQKSGLGETLVEITDVYSYPNPTVYNDVYVTLRLKAIQNKITKQYIYEGSPLLIHDHRNFKIQDLLINGEIIDIGQQAKSTQKFKVEFELFQKRTAYEYFNNSQALIKGVNNYVAKLMRSDLVIKDSRDENIVKITKVNKEPGLIMLATPNGITKLPDYERTQVTLELEVIGEKIGDHYYYRKEEPLIVDEDMYLTFDEITVQGVITSIEKID